MNLSKVDVDCNVRADCANACQPRGWLMNRCGGNSRPASNETCEIHADEFPWHASKNSEHKDVIQRLILLLYFLKQSFGQSRTI